MKYIKKYIDPETDKELEGDFLKSIQFLERMVEDFGVEDRETMDFIEKYIFVESIKELKDKLHPPDCGIYCKKGAKKKVYAHNKRNAKNILNCKLEEIRCIKTKEELEKENVAMRIKEGNS